MLQTFSVWINRDSIAVGFSEVVNGLGIKVCNDMYSSLGELQTTPAM